MSYEQTQRERERAVLNLKNRVIGQWTPSDWAIKSLTIAVIIIIMISCYKWGLTFHSFHSLEQARKQPTILYAIWCRFFIFFLFPSFSRRIFSSSSSFVGGIWNSSPICHYINFVVLTITQLNQLLFSSSSFICWTQPDEC